MTVNAITDTKKGRTGIAPTYLHTTRKNKRPPYWNSISGFNFDYITAIGILFCIMLLNFILIGAPPTKIWRRIDFSRWRPQRPNITSGFVFVDVAVFRRSKSANQTLSIYLNSCLRDWDITTSVLEQQTSAILVFYFRFRFWLHHRNRHLILHHPAQFRDFHPNRSIRSSR